MPSTFARLLAVLAALPAGQALAGFSDRVPADVGGEATSLIAVSARPVLRDPSRETGRSLGAGLATWYGPGFHGRRTASGERFDAGAMTAAHRSLPFGTRVRVVHQESGRSVVVRINDRGPHRRGAVIDLSRASAQALGMGGVARVRIVSAGE